MGFTKLFASIVQSTVWRAPDHVRLVWITMLALANRDGEVETSVPGLADASRVSLDQCVDALKVLGAPDEWSRTKDREGRRIEEINGGFRILNYVMYRQRMSAAIKREQGAERFARYAARKRAERYNSVSPNAKLTRKTHAEAEAEAEAEKRSDSVTAEPADRSAPAPALAVLLTFPVTGQGKDGKWNLTEPVLAPLMAAYPDTDVLAECRRALAWVAANPKRRKTAGGMPAFLTSWVARSVNSGGAGRGAPPVETPKYDVWT